MYQIKCFNGAAESYLYDARVKEYAVIAPHLALELNKSGLLTFGVPDSHPNRDQIIPLMSDIVVYEDDVAIWYGRSITNEKDFYKTGKITCEGELAFLYDSIYRPFAYTGTITQFLTNLINNHNSQVETRKEFTLGTVSVVDTNGNVARSSEDALKTLDVISTRLLSTNGGYLRVRHVGAVRYLDYLADYGNTAPQVIEFAKNLIDINQFIDATKVRTCLIPYGAEVTGSATGERVDITTVNGGLDYISNAGAVASYGQIWETVTFKDVTLPANLYAKALVYLGEMVAQSLTLKLSAVDLSVLGVETSIGIGDWVRVKSAPHGLDSLFLATARNIDMASPESTKISFGNVTQSFTTQNNQAKLDVSKSVDEISARILLATQLITGAVGGHVVFDPPEKPSRILIMDTADMATAQNVWQWNVNGLGFSSTGIDGTYGTAITMDGHIIGTFLDVETVIAARISNITSSAYYMTYGYLGSPGLECFMPTIGKFLGISPDVDGGVQFFDKNAKLRLYLAADGSFITYDQSGTRQRLIVSENGDTLIYDATGQVRFFQLSNGETYIYDATGAVRFAVAATYCCMKLASGVESGTDAGGGYQIVGGVKKYYATL